MDELARLHEAIANSSTLESVSLKAAIVMPHLLLQKPHYFSKTKENISFLKRRMEEWWPGKSAEEASAYNIISRTFTNRRKHLTMLLDSFADLVFQATIKQALEMSSKEGSDDPFNTNCTTWSVKRHLEAKTSPKSTCWPWGMYLRKSSEVHHVTYDAINATLHHYK